MSTNYQNHSTAAPDAQRRDQIATYIRVGCALVPIPRGEKGPRSPGWNRPENAITTIEVAAQQLAGDCNIGLAHAYCDPPTCALDIDDLDEARTWLADRGINLDALLDAPDAVRIHSGQPGRAKLIYHLQTPLQSCTLPWGELRCASSNRTTWQDVLPPSIHPSGHPYQWIGDPSKIPAIPESLLEVWQVETSNKATAHSATVDLAPADEAALTARLQAVQADPELAKLQRGEALRWMQHTSRSEFDFALALVLHRLGFTPSEIAALLLQYPHGKAAERADAATYISKIIAKIHARTETSAAPGFPAARHLTTDQANAQRLRRAAGSSIMYAAGHWFVWTGTHWSADEAAAYCQTCSLSALILDEADEWEHRPARSAEEGDKNKECVFRRT